MPIEPSIKLKVLQLCDTQKNLIRCWLTLRNKRPYRIEHISVLCLAARYGHIELIQDFLRADPKIVHERDEAGRTALIWASAKGHLDVVNLLLDSGADVDAELPGMGALLRLLNNRRLQAMKGAGIDRHNNECNTALEFASAQGHVNIVERLLDEGAKRRDNALILAAYHCRQVAFELLLHRGAARYEEALVAASEKGNTAIAEMLLSEGVNIDAQANGESALTSAVRRSRTETVVMLLRRGARVSQRIILAALGGGHLRLLKGAPVSEMVKL